MTFFDLFAGIGGFRLALERAGHTCVGFCEIDKFARQTYKANFNTEGEVEWHDITTVTDEDVRQLGSVDIITGGFPCQAFSVAGKRGGFNDTRGTLFFEIARIARILKPRYLLLENVKGLLNHARGDTFFTILNTLAELGYWWEYQVLNSKDFGVPQNRERVFIVGHLGGKPRRKVFPITGTSGQTIKQVGNLVETESFGGNPQRGRVYDPRGISPTLNTMQGGGLEPKIMQLTGTSGQALRQLVGGTQGYRVYDPAGVSVTLASQAGGMGGKTGLYAIPVLTPDRAEKRQNGRRFKEPGEPMFTLTSQDRHGVAISYGKLIPRDITMTIDAKYHKGFDNRGGRTGVTVYQKTHGASTTKKVNETGTLQAARVDKVPCVDNGVRIRRLTPLECFRLQGFPDEFFHRAKAAGVSDSQLYKQAGNAVTVNVVYEIAKRLGG